MKDYQINIFYSDEDESYIADIPDLKYCSAHGDTPEEALHEVLIAKAAWLIVAQEEGHCKRRGVDEDDGIEQAD